MVLLKLNKRELPPLRDWQHVTLGWMAAVAVVFSGMAAWVAYTGW